MTATAAGKAEIDALVLQVGAMRQLDEVIWIGEMGMSGVGRKFVREDEFWVPCHIPGRPLYPGVLMIEAAAQLCSFLMTGSGRIKGFLGFTRCDEAVFRGQVVPGDTFIIIAKEISFKPRRFISKTQGLVNGKLVFEA
ncbi:MAG: beta-hydroxyacyl-ACP dehydratase, partial [Phycisphaerales bacterium]|nr:beta-hydroxyacyl-ACP dehydratase [Phycisphaerales bacterium]